MTVGQFKTWCEDFNVSDEASILLSHPGGYDAFLPFEYDNETEVVVASGTG